MAAAVTTMGTYILELALMLSVIGGGPGGNQLLDYVNSRAYWKAKNVDVTVAAMQEQLRDQSQPSREVIRYVQNLGSQSDRIRQQALDSLRELGPAIRPALELAARDVKDAAVKTQLQLLLDDFAAREQSQAIRRLMAIRTLGELKNKAAVPALEALRHSERPFEAEYAAAALARIDGKPYSRPAMDAKLREQDLWLLPVNLGAVGQIVIPTDSALDVKTMLAPLDAPGENDAAARPVAQAVETMLTGLVDAAEHIGNVRLDCITFGVHEDPEKGVLLLFRGQYDLKLLIAYLQSTDIAVQPVAGLDVVQLGGDETDAAKLVLVDSQRIILLTGTLASPKQVDSLAKTLKAGKGNLEKNVELTNLVKAADRTQSVWAVVKFNESYRIAAYLKPFDTATLSGSRQGNTLKLTIEATGRDAGAVAGAAQNLDREIHDTMAQVTKDRTMPVLLRQTITKLLGDAQLSPAEGKATLNLNLSANDAGLLLLLGIGHMQSGRGLGPDMPDDPPGQMMNLNGMLVPAINGMPIQVFK